MLEEFPHLPAANILKGGLTPQSFASSIKATAELLTNFAKIGSLISLPPGFLLLISYLRDEGAPLPSAEASISVLLWIVCVNFVFLSFSLAGPFLLPALTNMTSDSESQTTNMSKKLPLQFRQFALKPKSSTLWRYWLRFGAFLSLVLFFFLAIGLNGKLG